MSTRDDLLNRLPREGFLKIAESRTPPLPEEQRVALIRKGNVLFNEKKYDLARKVFLTTGYADGLIRLGDVYMKENKPLEALKMYWLAPESRKVGALVERASEVLRQWLKESPSP
jgi:hypothetical protein